MYPESQPGSAPQTQGMAGPPISPVPGPTGSGYPMPGPAGSGFPAPSPAGSGYPGSAPVGSGFPMSGPGGSGYPGPPPPERPARSGLIALVVVIALLTVGLLVTAGLGLSSISRLHDQVAARQDTRDALAAQSAAAEAKQRDDFGNAGLTEKLQHVKDLDKAVDKAVDDWHDGTLRYGALATAIQSCNDAIADYDRAAGPFPDSFFGALPRQVNLNNPESDCGRAQADHI